jgi:hypothetical protein
MKVDRPGLLSPFLFLNEASALVIRSGARGSARSEGPQKQVLRPFGAQDDNAAARVEKKMERWGIDIV